LLCFRPPPGARRISFRPLNRKTGHRIKYRKVDAETGDEVDSADIIKGYEVGKGNYFELDPEELEAVALESKRIRAGPGGVSVAPGSRSFANAGKPALTRPKTGSTVSRTALVQSGLRPAKTAIL
jgi:hypothetical protein